VSTRCTGTHCTDRVPSPVPAPRGRGRRPGRRRTRRACAGRGPEPEGAELLDVRGVPAHAGLPLEPAHGRRVEVLVGCTKPPGRARSPRKGWVSRSTRSTLNAPCRPSAGPCRR
jgi:hypothetical protein